MKNFGIRLKALREDKGLSVEDVANALNISEIALIYWEKSAKCITISQLIKLAKYFSVTTDYLLGL